MQEHPLLSHQCEGDDGGVAAPVAGVAVQVFGFFQPGIRLFFVVFAGCVVLQELNDQGPQLYSVFLGLVGEGVEQAVAVARHLHQCQSSAEMVLSVGPYTRVLALSFRGLRGRVRGFGGIWAGAGCF